MVGGRNPPIPSKNTDEIVRENVLAILKALELLGFRSSGYKVAGTIKWHQTCVSSMGGNWMGWFKYKLSAWKAVMLNHDPQAPPEGIPAEDKPSVLLGGRAMMWLDLVRRTQPRRFAEIIATMDTVKRAMERPGEKELQEARVETFKLLTTERPVVRTHFQDQIQSTGITDVTMVKELERMVDDIFKDEQYTTEEGYESFFPSTNSNYLKTRSKGGAVGALLETRWMEKLKVPHGRLINFRTAGKSWRSQRVEMDDSSLSEKWKVLYEHLLDGAMEEDKTVQLHALPEAVKVRVISKGPPLTYTVLKPLQKWLWRKLRNHKSGVFRLVGEEISAKIIEAQIGQLKEGEKYLSGDYKAATDNLNPLYSDTVVNRIIHNCIKDERIAKLFQESLTGHLIENPEKKGEFEPQRWGQLMGSITSFPILCIVNATLCRLVREREVGRNLSLETSKILINGDDCVFRCKDSGRVFWENLAKQSGMKPSVGKYFFATEFLNMNSAQFSVEEPTCDLQEKGQKKPHISFLRQIPQINMGLLVGQGRTTSGKMEQVRVSDWGTLNSISKNAHTLIRDCAVEDRERVFKSYLNHNFDKLAPEKKGIQIPWFLPEHLGGLGLPVFPEHYATREDGSSYRPWMPTEQDLRQAAAFHKHGKLPSLPAAGVSWQVWKYAQRRMKDVPVENTFNLSELITTSEKPRPNSIYEDDEIEWQNHLSQNSLMGKFCVEALFTLSINELYLDNPKQNDTIGSLKSAISDCRRFMHKVEPFEADKLPTFHPLIEQERTVLRTPANKISNYFPFNIFSTEADPNGPREEPFSTDTLNSFRVAQHSRKQTVIKVFLNNI